jgi:hypothetical protein
VRRAHLRQLVLPSFLEISLSRSRTVMIFVM